MPRDKTEAARVLLNAGWTFEEVADVLTPLPPLMAPPLPGTIIGPPAVWPQRPFWETITLSGLGSTTPVTTC